MDLKTKNEAWIIELLHFCIYTNKSKPLEILNAKPKPFTPYLRHPIITDLDEDIYWIHLVSLLLYSIDTQDPAQAYKLLNIIHTYDVKKFNYIYRIIASFVNNNLDSTENILIRCWYKWYDKDPIIIYHVVMVLSCHANWSANVTVGNTDMVNIAKKQIKYLYRDIKLNKNRSEGKTSIADSTDQMDLLFNITDDTSNSYNIL